MKVFKLKNSSEPGVVIINIKSKISELEDKIINKFPGDLFFIFPESITKTINPEIFSNLYGATWYGIYKDDKIFGVWEALDYLESLTNYTSMSVVTSFCWIGDEITRSLQKLQYSGIETSVFKSRELDKKEKENLYLIPSKIIEIAFGVRFRWPRKKNRMINGKYSRKTTTDHILFLRPNSIRKMRENLSPEIIHSFKGLEIGSFISSLIPPDTYINVEINEAKI